MSQQNLKWKLEIGRARMQVQGFDLAEIILQNDGYWRVAKTADCPYIEVAPLAEAMYLTEWRHARAIETMRTVYQA